MIAVWEESPENRLGEGTPTKFDTTGSWDTAPIMESIMSCEHCFDNENPAKL
jgi:hypothetical protein